MFNSYRNYDKLITSNCTACVYRQPTIPTDFLSAQRLKIAIFRCAISDYTTFDALRRLMFYERQ